MPRCGKSPAPQGSLAAAAAKLGEALLAPASLPLPPFATSLRRSRVSNDASATTTIHPGPPPSLRGAPSVGFRRWRVVSAAQTPPLSLLESDATPRSESMPLAFGVRRVLFAGLTCGVGCRGCCG